MKIALDVSQIVYSGTGVGNYTHSLVKSLLELETDHEFLLYAGVLRRQKYLDNLKSLEPFSKASWKTLPVPPKIAARVFNRVNFPIENMIGNFDVFHASDWTHPYSNRPTLTTVHDLIFKVYPETVERGVFETQEKRMSRVVEYAAHIIADSQSTKDDIVKYYYFDPDRISVIHLAADPAYKPAKIKEINRVKKRYGIKGKYILSLGTKEPRKNLAGAVSAFRLLKDTHPDLQLIIVGRYGWGTPPEFESEGIIETGFAPDEDLPPLYSGAEAFLYPSLYEGFGLPVLEAMSCGTPVVTSNVSSLPEVTGTAGILVDPKDVTAIATGIKKALKSKEKLSAASLKRAARFTWEKTARETLSVYEKIGRGNK